MQKYNKEIVFQPEYYGETVAHPFKDLRNQKWISLGGTSRGIHLAIKTYQQVINSEVRINQYSSRDVEFAKYMENTFLASKVTFCNEMYDIAQGLGVDYNAAREVWVSDPRIGSNHTFVYDDHRGFDGKRLPKDLASLIAQAKECGVDASFLQSISDKNKKYVK